MKLDWQLGGCVVGKVPLFIMRCEEKAVSITSIIEAAN